jgi:hypothetical protein
VSGWADELRNVESKPPEDRIGEFTSLIPDVKTGDTMSFTRSGDDARAPFAVWFGPKPGDENLKRGMLGK